MCIINFYTLSITFFIMGVCYYQQSHKFAVSLNGVVYITDPLNKNANVNIDI